MRLRHGRHSYGNVWVPFCSLKLIGHERRYLRILSGQVGMESDRSYASGSLYSIEIGAGSVDGMFSRTLYEKSSEEGEQIEGTNRRIISTGGSLDDITSQFKALTNSSKVTSADNEDVIDTLEKIRQQIMKYLIQLLFGGNSSYDADDSTEDGIEETGTGTDTPTTIGIGYMNMTMAYEETEETSFSTQGTVKTADGREISFNVGLQMSRSFSEYYSQTTGYSLMVDPLVINMDTGMTEIEDQTFLFDLDCDGTKENVSSLGQGSGFLALDKNDNGKVDDGNELFGTKTGDGFGDLEEYDSDDNGWIDENDQVWDRLRIWTKDSDGNDLLYKLSDKKIGAICLQNVSTDFSQRSISDGQINGRIRQTGVFLYENGSAGTVQHVDLSMEA